MWPSASGFPAAARTAFGRSFVSTCLTCRCATSSRESRGSCASGRRTACTIEWSAFHVAQGIVVPMTAGEFYAGLDQRLPLRDGMYFLPAQAEEYEKLRAAGMDPEQAELFITGESSAVGWLRQLLGANALAFANIQPAFFQEVQKGTVGWDELPDLKELLDQNFVTDERGRYLVPDPKKAEHLEQLREAELVKVFDGYLIGTGPLVQFRCRGRQGRLQACIPRSGLRDDHQGRQTHPGGGVQRRHGADALFPQR